MLTAPGVARRLVPTAIVHGLDDDDAGGGLPWRPRTRAALPFAPE
jgi:hypothetical protein